MESRAIQAALVEEAQKVHEERREADERIGRFGAELMPQSGRVMTQCNAGRAGHWRDRHGSGRDSRRRRTGHKIEVLVPETRPYLQGARLTAWELHQDEIPLTLITDNMVGHFLKTGKVGAVVVGADRIARNGDTANKIGTYAIAVLAREHGVPFYVAAPISTLDLSIPSGEQIPIEERSHEEVTHCAGCAFRPKVRVANPAFDVTPARLIAAIITERGVARAPFEKSLLAIVKRNNRYVPRTADPSLRPRPHTPPFLRQGRREQQGARDFARDDSARFFCSR